MKPALAVLLLALAVAGCKRHGDAQVGDKLTGNWVATGSYRNGGNFKSTLTIGRSGNYVCHLVTQGESGPTRTNALEGTFQIKDGILTDTVTKHSNTNAVLPMITRARIVRIDEGEMVLKWDLAEGVESATNEVVFRRLGK